MDNGEKIDDELYSLAGFPNQDASYYKSFGVNGYRFRKRTVDKKRMTQNSGIAFPCMDGFIYYGVLDDVIAVRYQMREEPYYIFKCTWYETGLKLG